MLDGAFPGANESATLAIVRPLFEIDCS